ncbi:hypothetical protein HDU98_002115 [Podochytrium sp. JEL0797]|nr:hypothetical protein HDU98_002115 [Podochytrium sp. JEL0797]
MTSPQTSTTKDFIASLGSPAQWLSELPSNESDLILATADSSLDSPPLPLLGPPGTAVTDKGWMDWIDSMSSFPVLDSDLPPLAASSPASPSPTMTDSSCATSVLRSGKKRALVKREPRSRRQISPDSVSRGSQKGSNIEEMTSVEVKRARNTEAARRARARKASLIESLESSVTELTADKEKLKVRVATLESEAATFHERERDLKKRVEQLEAQLGETLQALLVKL